jgi:crotonobetainyl-CoA:carnitine CoA-transferase CaiB-like acyl-CoA transferase
VLSPFRVLDLTDGSSLLCGQILGDLGADVIIVEPPEGASLRREYPFLDGQPDPDRSLAFWALNRNKRSVTLDIASEEGRQRMKGLVRTADFLLESFEPGHLDALGLGYQALSAINPRLVMVSITPFGQDGPKAHWASADLTAYASSVALAASGDDDRPPVAVSVPQAYLHAGAEAAVGALLAHAARERDGVGQHVDVSAQTAAMMATQATVLSAGWGDLDTKRMAGGINFGGIPLKFIQPASDGFVSVTFLFGTAFGPFTRRLMEAMCEEGVVDEATRDKDWIGYTQLILSGQEPVSEFIRCTQAIGEFTRRHTRADLFKMGMDSGLLIVPVNTIDDVANSEQLAAREFWHDVEHPEIGKTVRYPGAFAKVSPSLLTTRRRPPLLGEHNDEVFAELPSRSPAPGTSAPASRPLPLEGVKVVDFMWVIAGPWGTRYLADYGATVVKVESTTRVDPARTVLPFRDRVPGAERSALYATLNAGKYGLTLDLTSPIGQEVAGKLLRWADVVTDNFTPGVMRRFGFAYETIRIANPGVIMLTSCLNGQTGPHANLSGFGTMGLHIAGFGDLAGWPDRPPAGAAGAYTDYIVPKFTAAVILAALDHRRRTGEGTYIDFSQAEASSHFLAPALLDYFANGVVQTRNGNASLDHSPHGVYPAEGEDRWVAIVATNEEQWQALSGVAGRDWASDSRFATLEARKANREALDSAIADWSAVFSLDWLEEKLQTAGVPVHRLSRSADALSDPQLLHRGHFVTVEHPELGPVPIEASRIKLSATPATISAPGPVLGQHNEMVLRDLLGLSDEEFVEALTAGALQ